MRNLGLVLVAAALLASPAAAEWNKMDGQPLPGITAEKWLNAGKKGPDLSALRGKVILLEFFATW